MPSRHVPPSIRETAFSCPHCGAFTTQYWYDLYADRRDKEKGGPFRPNDEFLRLISEDRDIPEEARRQHTEWFKSFQSGLPFLEGAKTKYDVPSITNLNVSLCYECKKFAVWVHDAMVFPAQGAGPDPNPDLSEDVLRDYEEARRILNVSPRGAAALLRLAIQKLCKELGGNGKDLNTDIALLVQKGLSPIVQKSLDIVRVIGNESVHPGTIDLRDDRNTAEKLFSLVNLIAEQMISTPKHVNSLYESLPEKKRVAIATRDKNRNETSK